MLLPPPPQIFFGRSAALEHLLNLLEQSKASPVYIAILGTGGIGKTALGVAFLHHSSVVMRFGDFRWFISCEGVFNAEDLRSTLANAFKLDEKNFIACLRQLASSTKAQILLTLDNLETPWEPKSSQQAVEELLQQLTDVPGLSLVVTLRGAERPSGIPWTRPFLPPLHSLDYESSIQTFTSISDVPDDAAGLSELVQLTDGLPLAVTLMATQAQYTSCSLLLSRWNNKRTTMLTRGAHTRLSSIDVSIQMSLESDRINPSAIAVLQMLSLLPDGILDADITKMSPANIDPYKGSSTLLQIALAFRDAIGRLKCLSPIREYIQSHRPTGLSIVSPLVTFYGDLSKYAHEAAYTAERSYLLRMITPQIGNLQTVITRGMGMPELSEKAIDACATEAPSYTTRGSRIALVSNF